MLNIHEICYYPLQITFIIQLKVFVLKRNYRTACLFEILPVITYTLLVTVMQISHKNNNKKGMTADSINSIPS